MTKRILTGIVLAALVAPLVLAQVPAQRKTLPREKPRMNTSVTVIDLRNMTGEKKPPKRLAEPAFQPRMKSPGSKTAAVAGLPSAQLSEALRNAGITVPPPNVYARFTPGQPTASGKGYMFMLVPEWVYPDHAEFFSSWSGQGSRSLSGAMVVLREPGTYVFDFLIEFPYWPAGTSYNCDVMIGLEAYQTQALTRVEGPQHVLVIWPMDQAMLSLEDRQRSVGIHCYQPGAADELIGWTFYLLDVTKL